jgi:hypothetical protein
MHPRDWWESMRRVNRMIARHLKSAWSPKPAVRNLARQRLLGALSVRNNLYKMRPLCIWAAPIIAGHIGAAAGNALKPHVDEAGRRYREWTLGGRGGFEPGELIDE